jgi:YVTN family beta-propeller protein
LYVGNYKSCAQALGGSPPLSGGNTVTVVNTKTNTVVDTIPLAGPSGNGIAITPNSAQVYVTSNSPTCCPVVSNNTVSAINVTTKQVTTILAESSPYGVAVKP